MIPTGLTDKHFRRAAAQIDREGVRLHRKSVHYDLALDGKSYPPKYVISLASRFATGVEHSPSKFNAVEARDYFRHGGYKVIDRRDGAEQNVAREDDQSVFPEGRERFRVHRYLERDGTISRKAKAKRLAETGRLECEVCRLEFVEVEVYGARGEGFIESHHKLPVSKLTGKEKTKISDLALVCSNCHRMLHRGSTLLGVSELKNLVEQRRGIKWFRHPGFRSRTSRRKQRKQPRAANKRGSANEVTPHRPPHP